MNVRTLQREIRAELRELADPIRAENEQRYFKGTIRSVGVTLPKSQKLAREILQAHRDEPPDAWLKLADRLLAGGWFEEGVIGLYIVKLRRPPATDVLFDTYERWLGSYVGNWAHCDSLCGSLIGPVLVERPRLVKRVMRWTGSTNRWMRRGAAVSLLMPARQGLFLAEALRIAEALLDDDDDLVQKGFGWMLREQAETHRPEVTAFLEWHVDRMPRTAFRYAIEKYPTTERKRLMAL